jgi:hypothetical protein
VESTTRLGDWYGDVLRLGSTQYLIFISEHSRLAVVLPARNAKALPAILPDKDHQAAVTPFGAVAEYSGPPRYRET